MLGDALSFIDTAFINVPQITGPSHGQSQGVMVFNAESALTTIF